MRQIGPLRQLFGPQAISVCYGIYIIDTGFTDNPKNTSHIRIFDVDVENGKVSNSKMFVEIERPSITDGMRADRDGRIWCSVGWGDPKENGVRCYTPSGELLGKIHLPEDRGQFDLRRHAEKPVVHRRLNVALRRLHERAGRDEAVNTRRCLAPRANNSSLRAPVILKGVTGALVVI